MSFSAVLSGNFCHLRNALGSNCGCKLLKFQSGFTYGRVVDARACSLRFFSTKAEGKNQKSQSEKPCNINLNIHDGPVKAHSTASLNKPQLHELQAVQCYDLQREREAFDWPAVVLVFDIETTGFNREKERIIEIGIRDLSGGKNSTFQTLVNPGMVVTNADIHGIKSHMVNRPDVPRFEVVLPFLLKFIRSRQKDGKQIALFAHNARSFDVPFLKREFQRCNMEIPDDILFVDTLLFARRLLNPDGSKLKSRKLSSLRQRYNIKLNGCEHRAMQDVDTLSYVLQGMTYELKLTITELLDEGFRASDLDSCP